MRRRWVRLLALAVAVAGAVNVAAARLDAHSDAARRAAAEDDVRAWMTRHHIHARVDCRSGRSCSLIFRDGRVMPIDPVAPELR